MSKDSAYFSARRRRSFQLVACSPGLLYLPPLPASPLCSLTSSTKGRAGDKEDKPNRPDAEVLFPLWRLIAPRRRRRPTLHLHTTQHVSRGGGNERLGRKGTGKCSSEESTAPKVPVCRSASASARAPPSQKPSHTTDTTSFPRAGNLEGGRRRKQGRGRRTTQLRGCGQGPSYSCTRPPASVSSPHNLVAAHPLFLQLP